MELKPLTQDEFTNIIGEELWDNVCNTLTSERKYVSEKLKELLAPFEDRFDYFIGNWNYDYECYDLYVVKKNENLVNVIEVQDDKIQVQDIVDANNIQSETL